MRYPPKTEFKQGTYNPIHPEKCKNSVCEYRSSFELKAFKWLDTNPNVVQWSSERVIIPYFYPIDQKMHKYYVDLWVMIREGNNITQYLIEIKPDKQCRPPTPSNRKKKSTILYEQLTWEKNKAKWNAAKQFCESKGWKFQLLTEKELGI